jgi:hypothetical protein
MIHLGKKLADALSSRSFLQELAKHMELPYSQWWRQQLTGENIL